MRLPHFARENFRISSRARRRARFDPSIVRDDAVPRESFGGSLADDCDCDRRNGRNGRNEMIVAVICSCHRGRVAVLPECRVSVSADLPRCLATGPRGYCLNVITIAGGGNGGGSGESYDRRRGRKEYAGVFRRRSQLPRAPRGEDCKVSPRIPCKA